MNTQKKMFYKVMVVSFMILAGLFHASVYAIEFPEVDSKIVEVYDLTEDKILYKKNAKRTTMIASLTKIATAITAIENIENLDEKVTIVKEILKTVDKEASVAGLKEGDVVTYKDLLYAILVPSGADAAHAIAILSSGSLQNFVDKMNKLANKVGLEDTHFTNVTGLEDAKHYSTGDDVRKLLVYGLKNPVFREIYTTKKYTLSNGLEVKSTLYRYNIPPKDIGKILGSKTGYLENLGYCLSSLSLVDGHEIVTINFGAKHVGEVYYNIVDNIAIIDFLNEHYGEQVLAEKGITIKEIPVRLSKMESYAVKCGVEVRKFLAEDYDRELVRTVFMGVDELSYKNKAGEKIGKVEYYYGDELIAEEDVVLEQDIGISLLKLVKEYIWWITRGDFECCGDNCESCGSEREELMSRRRSFLLDNMKIGTITHKG